MDNKKAPSKKQIAFYTAYLNKLKELGEMANEVPKRYVIGLIVPEFFISIPQGERIINNMVKKDLNLDTLVSKGLKGTVVKKILGIYFEDDKSGSE